MLQRYGCDHEHKAVDAYKLKQLQLHLELKIVLSGFVVYLDKACFGASSDTYVDCSCYGPGVLEVKCLLCMRTEDFDVALERPLFCLERGSDGNWKLNSHCSFF